MAVVMNVRDHVVPLTVGLLGPREQRNVDTSLPLEAALLEDGTLVITNGETLPPVVLPPAPTAFRRVRVAKGAAPAEAVFQVRQDADEWPRLEITSDGLIRAGDGTTEPAETELGGGSDELSRLERAYYAIFAQQALEGDVLVHPISGVPRFGTVTWPDGSIGTFIAKELTGDNTKVNRYTVSYRPFAAPPGLAAWRPTEGFAALSDVDAAAHVVRVPEVRSAHQAANSYVPSSGELAAFLAARPSLGSDPTENPYVLQVTGRCPLANPTTDELIQWASWKWGIPTDRVRAQMVQESGWSMSYLGDLVTQPDQEHYDAAPAFARVPDTLNVYESLGISQLRWFPDKTGNENPHPGTEPLRWKSTAFNLDYYGAVVRFYFDDPGGRRTAWGDGTYEPGNEWLAQGGWYLPYPWNNAGQQTYVAAIQARLAARGWLVADFSDVHDGIRLLEQPTITRSMNGSILDRPPIVEGPYAVAAPPGAPTGVTISAGSGSITLDWTPPANEGGAPIVRYRMTNVEYGWSLDTDYEGQHPYTMSGLENGVPLSFNVRAIGATGSVGAASANTVQATPTAPTVPGTPTGVAGTGGDGQVALSWTVPASNGGAAITGYRITPRIAGVPQTPINTGSTATSRAVTGLTNGTAYTFTVAATNSVGTGTASTASAAVTPDEPDLELTHPAAFPIISRGKTATGSGDGTASNAFDNTTGTAYRSYPVFPPDGTPAHVTCDLVGEDLESSLFTILLTNDTRPSLNRAGGLGTGGVGQSKVNNYKIRAAAGSSLPAIGDGAWTDILTVTGNRWSDVQHANVDLSGHSYRFLDVYVTSSTGSSDNRDVAFTSIEVRDQAAGTDNSIMFWGDSRLQEFGAGRSVDGPWVGVGPLGKTIEDTIGEEVPLIAISAEGGYGINTYYSEYATHLDHFKTAYIWPFMDVNDANGWGLDINTLSPGGVDSTAAQQWKSRYLEMIDYATAHGGRKWILAKGPLAFNNAWTRANMLVIHDLIDEIIAERPGVAFAGPDFGAFFDLHPELFRYEGPDDRNLHQGYNQAGPAYSAGSPWTTGDPRGRWDAGDGDGPLTGYQWTIKLIAIWLRDNLFA